MELVPKEIALFIFSFLEPKDLSLASQICRRWNILVNNDFLWEHLTKTNFPRTIKQPRESWKSLFRNQYEKYTFDLDDWNYEKVDNNIDFSSDRKGVFGDTPIPRNRACYFEVTLTQHFMPFIGIGKKNEDMNLRSILGNSGILYRVCYPLVYVDGKTMAPRQQFESGDVVGVLVNLPKGTIHYLHHGIPKICLCDIKDDEYFPLLGGSWDKMKLSVGLPIPSNVPIVSHTEVISVVSLKALNMETNDI